MVVEYFCPGIYEVYFYPNNFRFERYVCRGIGIILAIGCCNKEHSIKILFIAI